MLKVLELFAGIGACSKALTNLGIEHEIIDAVEIDKYAIKSFDAIHGTNFEPQDIKTWDKDIKANLIMHGSPCQDFSVAGRQAGMGEGGGNVPLVPIKTANKKGYDIATDGDGIDLAYPQSATRRGRVGHGVAKTIPTGDSQGTLDGFRIRKLTPRECWRLMGFDDADFDKAQAIGTSNTQLYKQAGNSIVVNCLEAIFEGIEWNDD